MKEKDQSEKKDVLATALREFSKSKKEFLDPKDFNSWRMPTGSLILDGAINGGITPGVTVLGGASKGGKTSSLIAFIKEALLSNDKVRAIYYDAEGRVTDAMRDSSGITFVEKDEDWKNGTCLIKWPKNYEVILDHINVAIKSNNNLPKEEKSIFYFVVDSIDALVKKANEEKEIDDSTAKGETAQIMSRFFKKSNMVFNKLGHALFLVKQVRSTFKIVTPGTKPQHDVNESVSVGGGHATTHAANNIWEYQGRAKGRKIGDEKKPDGHYCKIILKKSEAADIGIEVQYPVKYIDLATGTGRVWIEYEVYNLMLQWSFLEQRGSWLFLDEDIAKELSEKNFDIGSGKFHGEKDFLKFLEDKNDVTLYLRDKFKKLIYGS